MSFACAHATDVEEDADAALSNFPRVVRDALHASGLPPSAFAIVVQPVRGTGLRLALNDATPMRPASTLKLVTTYAALELLGPAYRWRTDVFASGALHGETLEGDLLIRGGGDPKLVVENLWLLVQRVRGYGIRDVHGDLVIDRSAFTPIDHDPAKFDGEPLRPYNTGPDALLLNFKTLSFEFVPDPETRSVRVVPSPPLAGLKWPSNVPGSDGPCGDWRTQLRADFSMPLEPVFSGSFPLSCGDQVLHINVLDHPDYFSAVFRALWEQTGGTLSGQLREGLVPATARRVATQYSPPLADVIRDINKFSNNVMARQVFLALGTSTSGNAASVERSTDAVRAWLRSRGIPMPELVLENGSGLSRSERISARNMAQLLRLAFDGPLMPEFVASLPIVGVDGTLQHRRRLASSAHVKGGILEGVRAIAGYVDADSGRRYVVVVIVNHPQAARTEDFQDTLLEWIAKAG